MGNGGLMSGAERQRRHRDRRRRGAVMIHLEVDWDDCVSRPVFPRIAEVEMA